MNSFNKFSQGFNLIELIITLAIVSILALFVYPNYKGHIVKMRRIDAKTALFDLANRLENYHLENNTYERASIATGFKSDVLSSSLSSAGWYNMRILEVSKTSFLIQAIALKNQAIDDLNCAIYTLTNNGVRGLKNECW